MEINVEINIHHTLWTFSNYFCLTITVLVAVGRLHYKINV